MTADQLPTPSRSLARPDPAATRRTQGPVVVLGDPYCGAATLQRMLSRHAALACTSGTGLLPVCERAAITWLQVENRDGPLSQLAVASIRAMTDSLIITALARTGGTRWCEIAFAHPHCAEVFLQLYPSAKFICLHRSYRDMITAAVAANPWGLADSIFQSFAVGYPGNSVAAIAAYWVSRTEAILDFERAHPAASHRVRFEDLMGSPGQICDEVYSFLALSQGDPAARHRVIDDPLAEFNVAQSAASRGGTPLDWIPPQIRIRLDDLTALIGYPPVPT